MFSRFCPSYFLIILHLVCIGSVVPVVGQEEIPRVSVHGTAKIEVKPDRVSFTVANESRAENLEAAVDENTRKITAILSVLEEAGISEENLRTESVQIQTVFPSRRSREIGFDEKLKPEGFIAYQRISVTLNDIASYSNLYQQLTKSGATTIDDLTYSSSEFAKHRKQARINAVRAAKEKAKLLAGELDAKLGGVHSISEFPKSSSRPRVVFNDIAADLDRARSGSSSSYRIATGTIDISADVYVVFRLADISAKE